MNERLARIVFSLINTYLQNIGVHKILVKTMIHNVRFVQRRNNFSTTQGKSKIFTKIYQKSTTFHALCV